MLQPRTPRHPLQGSRAQEASARRRTLAGSVPRKEGGREGEEGGVTSSAEPHARRTGDLAHLLTAAHKYLRLRHLPAPSAPRSGPGTAMELASPGGCQSPAGTCFAKERGVRGSPFEASQEQCEGCKGMRKDGCSGLQTGGAKKRR